MQCFEKKKYILGTFNQLTENYLRMGGGGLVKYKYNIKHYIHFY